MHKGMSEVEAIKNADQFAENVIAGRSRGNMPTVFDSKNPLVKIFTAFQLEVNNQYGYMFKDMPQDMRNEKKTKLIQGYATMFIGATLYNALYSSITGRDAAFDPIKIIHELLKDIFDDDEEDPAAKGKNIILNFTDDVLEEVPFIGGLLGGGRIPISSALPYGEGIKEAYDNTVTDFADGNWESLTKEWLNPLYYLVLPMGGGQLRKTVQGLNMFNYNNTVDGVTGSYTDSGNLRFPVEDTFSNQLQAGLFGQYASENARDYFDNERTPLKEKQIKEFSDAGMTIQEYWKYRDEVNEFEELEDKINYIANMDLPMQKKNLLANNILNRDEDIDLTEYNEYSSFEEFDYYQENPELKSIAKAVGGYASFRYHLNRMNNFTSDKDENGNTISGSKKNKVLNYIYNADLDYGEKLILYKSQYKSDDNYNTAIIDYLNERSDISYTEMKEILENLGFKVDSKGNISW